MEPIDIFITAYLRPQFTRETLRYLFERTRYPFRLFLIHLGGNDEVIKEYADKIFLIIDIPDNIGIHASWNIALSLAESKYFITSDNDIYVPDLISYHKMPALRVDNNDKVLGKYLSPTGPGPCWLERMVGFMDERKDYGAISLHPHVIIGNASEDPTDPEDVKEVDHCGAVMRIMRRSAVWSAGGWERQIKSGRNHEEKTICSRLHEIGMKVGRTTRIRAYHPFGENWGYPESFTPEMQNHNPNLKDYVKQFDHMEAYDQKTWLPK